MYSSRKTFVSKISRSFNWLAAETPRSCSQTFVLTSSIRVEPRFCLPPALNYNAWEFLGGSAGGCPESLELGFLESHFNCDPQFISLSFIQSLAVSDDASQALQFSKRRNKKVCTLEFIHRSVFHKHDMTDLSRHGIPLSVRDRVGEATKKQFGGKAENIAIGAEVNSLPGCGYGDHSVEF